MSLKVPKINKKTTLEEELFVQLFNLAEDQIDFLIDKSITSLERGRDDIGNKYMKGGNIFYYLLYYGMNIFYFMQRTESNSPMIDVIEEKYKIVCVENKLECLSAFYGVNYKKFWEEVTKILGIPRERGNQEECCLGIGEMVIQGDECKVFQIGPCDFTEDKEGEYEFADYEFLLEEFNVEF